MNNIQARKWQITINNPLSHGLDRQTIKDKLQGLKSVLYGCMADERGLEEATPHTHIYIACSSPVRFSTLQKQFNGAAHLEAAIGTSQQNRDYVAKEIHFLPNGTRRKYATQDYLSGAAWAYVPDSETQEAPHEREQTTPLDLERGGETD